MAAFRSRNEASRCKSISNDSDADGYNSETEEPRSKRPKKEFSGNRGAACYKTKFNKEWTKIYPFIWKVMMSTNFYVLYVANKPIWAEATWRGILVSQCT